MTSKYCKRCGFAVPADHTGKQCDWNRRAQQSINSAIRQLDALKTAIAKGDFAK